MNDSTASRYKNYKSLGNLSVHDADYNLNTEYHFFPTSHGKNPSDIMEGTKQGVANAILTAANQILCPFERYTYAKGNVKGIQILFISSDDVTNHERKFK